MLTAGSGQGTEALQRRRAVVGVAWAIAAFALCVAAPPAPAQDNLPGQLGVTVVPPSSPGCPPPSGRIVVSLDGRQLLSVPVVPGSAAITALTPAVIARLQALDRPVQISYSGDAEYEPSAPVTVTLPADTTVVIVPRCRDEQPPPNPPDEDDPTDREDPSDGKEPSDGDDPPGREDPRDGDRPDREDPRDGDDPPTPGTPTSPATPTTPSDPATPAAQLTSAFLIEILSPREGARYEVGEAVEADYSCRVAGGGSQIASCEGTVASGSMIDTSSAGTRRFTVNAEDDRGRRARKTVTYVVATNGDGQPEQAVATPYDPRDHPTRMLGILLAGFTLLRLAERGGLALARGAGGVADSAGNGASAARASREGAEYNSADAVFLGAGFGAVALGDRSRTWRWPGTPTLDAISRRLPALLVRRSPLLARVVADGTYLRAIFGSTALLGPLAGIALGVMAVRDTGGDALAPAAALTIAIAVLGVFDAAAGFIAVLTFVLGVVAFGSADTTCAIAAERMSAECVMSWTDDVRLMLGLAALWFVVPVLAGAARPLRRRPARTLTESWDRGADFVIDSLIGAWAVHSIVGSLPAMAGVELAIADDASLIAACVLIALVVRLALETLAAHLYPRRLDVSEAGDLPEPGRFQRFGASMVRTTLFVFVAYIIAGSSWQLWTGAALFLIPQILALYEERFPRSRALARALPRGLLEIVLTLLVLAALTALLKNAMDVGSRDFLPNSFVLLALPGFVLSMLSLFGEQPQDEPAGWGKRVAGIVLLAVGVLLVVGAA